MLNALFSLLSQFVPLIITFLLAGASYWIAVQGELDLFGLNSPNANLQTDYYIQNFHVQSQDLRTQKLSMLQGEQAKHLTKDDSWIIEQPIVQQFQATGSKMTASAQTAHYLLDKDTVTLWRNVKVSSTQQGTTTELLTDQLQIDNINGTVSSASNVIVNRPGQSISSRGILLDQRTGEIKSQGRIKMKLEANK